MREPGAVEAFESPSPSTSSEKPRARTFREVQHDELEAIRHLRQARHRHRVAEGNGPAPAPVPVRSEAPDAIDRAHRSGLVGLSCSGGGIRSATFNLGVVQGLARLGLLTRLDYLSTNSGGGFLGGWLVAWMQRAGARRVEAELGTTGSGDAPEPRPLRFLRAFSNYLTPRVGAFSADNWTLIATYLRNLFLNLLILALALAAILLLPRLLLLVSDGVGDVAEVWTLGGLPFPLLLATVFLAVGIFFLGRNQMRLFPRLDRSPPPWYARQAGVQVTVVLPLLLAAWAGGLWMWFSVPKDTFSHADGASGWSALLHRLLSVIPGSGAFGELLAWSVSTALVYTALWLLGYLAFLLTRRREALDSLARRRRRLWRLSLATALPAGAGGGFLLWVLLESTQGLERLLWPGPVDASFHLLHVTAFRGPIIVVVFMLTAFLHTGLLGREFPESLRQWWSRLGAWLLIYSLVWVALCALAFYGGMALEILGSTVVFGLGVAWLGSTLLGLLAGKREGSPDGPTRLQSLIMGLAPYVFILGLLALLSLGLQLFLSPAGPQLSAGCDASWMRAAADEPFLSFAHRVVGCHSERLWKGTDPLAVPLLWLLLTGSAMLLSWRVDINEFSMHLFYRNRLIRAYLGASNPDRQAQSFTGFDPEDDLDLARLIPSGMEPPRCPEASPGRTARSAPTRAASTYDGPYPILNLTLNLVQGEELAWQERKGASFVCTPLYTGYPHESIGKAEEDPSSPLEHAGFRPTRCYLETPPREGISLGTAMAISGAAASPNQGAASTPAMAFLLTVFNVRLGWWLGNPRHRDTWNRMGPRVGLLTLLAELFGYSGEDSRYVHLSDGGHFDNCALYEMVRRRARLIVSTDAGADPDLAFSDIANVIRKCWVDFGIEIELDTRAISDGRAHCAVGRIRYDRVDPGAEPGWILFLKASLTGDEPRDIQSYAVAHPAFPHESTADQWFSESQLESYRKLGRHIALAAFRPLVAAHEGHENGQVDLPTLVRSLATREIFERLHGIWGASDQDGPA